MKSNENKLLKESQRIRLFTFILYSLPSIPITSAQMIVYIIIPPIYSLLPNVGIALTGLAIMLSRIVDMISDPIMGTYLDNIVSNNKTVFLKSSKIFTIGLETKDKLNKISFSNVFNANSNSESLIELILENTCQSDFGLWIAATDRSVDLKEILTKRNRKSYNTTSMPQD